MNNSQRYELEIYTEKGKRYTLVPQ
jgi:hypothetical protein